MFKTAFLVIFASVSLANAGEFVAGVRPDGTWGVPGGGGGGSSFSVNVTDYGASPTAAPDVNAKAFTDAMAASPSVGCPDAVTYSVQTIAVPPSVTRIFGGCKLVAAGTMTPNRGLIDADSPVNKLTIDGPTVQVDGATYPGVDGINVRNAMAGVTIKNATASGFFAFKVTGSKDVWIEKSRVSTYGGEGIYVNQSQNISILTNVCNSPGGGTSHCIGVAESNDILVKTNIVHGSGSTGFGICIVGNMTTHVASNRFAVIGNVISGTTPEAINVTGPAALGTVADNVVNLTGNVDFGMSINGTTDPLNTVSVVTFKGNTILNSCKSGIAFADNVVRSAATDNFITNPDACNGATDDYKSGVLLYGAGASGNVVHGNSVIDTNNRIQYTVNESGFAGTGSPSNNFIGINTGAKPQHIVSTGSIAGQTCAAGAHQSYNGMTSGC